MRTVYLLRLVCMLLAAACLRGESRAQPAPTRAPQQETLPTPAEDGPPLTPDSFATPRDQVDGACTDCYDAAEWQTSSGEWLTDSLARLHEFSSRNSFTHGRATGLGQPLRGTSWLNRPYEVSLDFGAFLMTGNAANGVSGAHDHFAAVTAGWDWDHYWGAQARLGWSTPNLGGGEPDNMFLTDVSLIYYPWGDSKIRPYWRMGMGLTDLEFTNINGVRQQQHLFTIPFGVGVKHQTRRWLAWRLEVVDNLALGANGTDTMNNLTITCGMEARYGGRPSGYWAWSPRGRHWW